MLCIGVGQCGNQILNEFFESSSCSSDCGSHPFYTSLKDPFSVRVDSEPKVVRRYVTSDSKYVVYSQSGRANNWAMGYGFDEMDLLGRTMEAVRRRMESCDRFEGVAMFHSTSGGTGSGLGSRLMKEFRDMYSRKPILISVAVSGYENTRRRKQRRPDEICMGDTGPLRHYNTILAMDTIQRHADACMFFSNSRLLRHQVRSSGSSKNKKVGMTELNRDIANAVWGSLEPPCKSDDSYVRGHLDQLLRDTVPVPEMKLLQAEYAGGYESWSKAWGEIEKVTKSLGEYEENVIIGSRLACRGKTFPDNIEISSRLRFRKRPVVLWCSRIAREDNDMSDLKTRRRRRAGQSTCNLSFTHNNTRVARENVALHLRRLRALLDAKAYLHWYERYGVGKFQIESAMETMRCVVDEYRRVLSLV
jgi:hypothetical protein